MTKLEFIKNVISYLSFFTDKINKDYSNYIRQTDYDIKYENDIKNHLLTYLGFLNTDSNATVLECVSSVVNSLDKEAYIILDISDNVLLGTTKALKLVEDNIVAQTINQTHIFDSLYNLVNECEPLLKKLAVYSTSSDVREIHDIKANSSETMSIEATYIINDVLSRHTNKTFRIMSMRDAVNFLMPSITSIVYNEIIKDF